MTVVVDSSALVALALDEAAAKSVERQMEAWVRTGEEIRAPMLALYEVFSGLAKRAIADPTTSQRLRAMLQVIAVLPISYEPPTLQDSRPVEVAIQLRRHSAYDATYLSLAERLGATLWTLDGPLYRNAVGYGYHVQLFA